MITEMYYDTFTNEYVLERDEDAPPERYLLTTRGASGIYVDHWSGDNGRCMDVAYSAEEYYSPMHDIRLRDMEEENNFEAHRLRYFTLPAEKFDEYVERFGLAG